MSYFQFKNLSLLCSYVFKSHLLPFSPYFSWRATLSLYSIIYVQGAHGQACMCVDFIPGFRTPPPSHFHYGQISGLCYGSVAFCRRAGSLITHTALLHFHFLFIEPPFHSGFIILPSELSGLPECLQPVEMT